MYHKKHAHDIAYAVCLGLSWIVRSIMFSGSNSSLRSVSREKQSLHLQYVVDSMEAHRCSTIPLVQEENLLLECKPEHSAYPVKLPS